MVKVALAFWGITRSLKYTIESIEKNILDVLREQEIEYKIFMHTYFIDGEYINHWAKESNTTVDNKEYLLLKPDYVKIDNQCYVKSNLELDKYRTHPDPWKYDGSKDYQTVDNFITSMFSKLNVTTMILNSNEEFDYILFLRPDVKYCVKLNTKWFGLVNDNTICTTIGGGTLIKNCNFCDRHSICNKKTLILYGCAFNHILSFSMNFPCHSETFYYILMKQHNINICEINFPLIRVRMDGTELELDVGRANKFLNNVNNVNTVHLNSVNYENSPFSHCVIDNFVLNVDLIESISKEIDNYDINTANDKFININSRFEYNKFAFNRFEIFSNELKSLFEHLSSHSFINQLEELTGIYGIIRNDVELKGSGVHITIDKGKLGLHTDFNMYNHEIYGKLDRRINLLLYLNDNWKESYNGDILLVNKENNQIEKKIAPIKNRCLIFNTTKDSVHGHPYPLNVNSSKIKRKSIAMYYYTKNMNNNETDFQGEKECSTKWFVL